MFLNKKSMKISVFNIVKCYKSDYHDKVVVDTMDWNLYFVDLISMCILDYHSKSYLLSRYERTKGKTIINKSIELQIVDHIFWSNRSAYAIKNFDIFSLMKGRHFYNANLTSRYLGPIFA